MERMLRKKKDNSDYEIDRELTGKFAIEKNAEYQDRIAELEEENEKLKSDLAYERTMLDNVRAEYKSLQNVIKKLKEELKETKETLNHRDSFFSIMRDVLANETITNNEIAMIVYCVVHEECGDYDLSEKELEVVKKFWRRKYV